MGLLRESMFSFTEMSFNTRLSYSHNNLRGDSWRARVSFLPELQVNISSGAMTIDFGGLDRWDINERQRNLSEAEITIPSTNAV